MPRSTANSDEAQSLIPNPLTASQLIDPLLKILQPFAPTKLVKKSRCGLFCFSTEIEVDNLGPELSERLATLHGSEIVRDAFINIMRDLYNTLLEIKNIYRDSHVTNDIIRSINDYIERANKSIENIYYVPETGIPRISSDINIATIYVIKGYLKIHQIMNQITGHMASLSPNHYGATP